MKKIQILLLLLLGLVFLDFYLLKSYQDLKESIISGVSEPISYFGGLIQKPVEPKEKEIKLILVGDILLGRSVMNESLKQNDPIYPFRKVADRLKSADLVFANLENPVIENCPKHEGGFKFCSKPEMLEGLIFSGIDVVSLANNHTLNYGSDGLAQTKKYLTEKEIAWTGFGELVVKEVGGVKFGFLGFDLTIKNLTDSDLILVSDSDKLCDVLVVGVHWGAEYRLSANSFQLSAAKRLVEAGAEVIAGHHPHWVQPFDYAQGEDGEEKIVFYSLGNFVFDQMWSEETKKGIIAELTFSGKNPVGQKVTPTYIRNLGQPEIVD